MKKAIIAVATVLLALVMVTCDAFNAPEKEEDNIVYRDGKPWGVNLTIGAAKGARALTQENAETYTDYYEVAFMYDGKTYRTSWRAGQTGRIAVPFGTYDKTSPTDPDVIAGDSGAALLFAGTYTNRDLLGVGSITEINDTTTTSYEINAATNRVTFKLIPLKNDINDTGSSTFQVEDIPDSNPLDPPIWTASVAPVRVTINQKLYASLPLFSVAQGEDNTAIWTFNGENFDGVILQGVGKVDSVGLIAPGTINGFKIGKNTDDDPLIAPTDGAGTGDALATAATAGDISFDLKFSVPAQPGLSWLGISIPVCALEDDADTNPGVWYIRGGLRNYEFDEGNKDTYDIGTALVPDLYPKVDSVGGGILIGTQAYQEIEVIGTY